MYRRALVRVLREELSRTDDRERLLGFARRWLYDHRLIIVHERRLRAMIAAARRQQEAELARRIERSVEPSRLAQWRTALSEAHDSGSSLQSWLWAPPAKHSSRQVEEMVDRIERLYALRVHDHLRDFPDDLLPRHAKRLAGRPPSAGALIREPVRSIETACFLRYCLLTATDRLLLMVRRRLADLWRRAASGANAAPGDWAACYQDLSGHALRVGGRGASPERVWQVTLASPDRERAFCAFEVATLLGLRRALRNGTVWIDHSLAFRSREQLGPSAPTRCRPSPMQ